MRIAFLCFQAFQRGGIRTYTRKLLNGIAAIGHEVVLFAPPPPAGTNTGLNPEVRVEPVVVPSLPLTSALAYWWSLPRILVRMERRDGRFDVVHSNVYADFLLSKRSARGVRIVTVYHLANTAAESAGLQFHQRLSRLSSEYGPAVIAEGACLKRADHIIAISNFTRNDILQRYPDIASGRVSVIYLGASTDSGPSPMNDKTALISSWGIGRGERIALAVGRLEDRKGVPFLLQALSQVPSGLNLKLVFIGSGRTDAHKATARRLGVADRVVFAGYVDDSTLNAAYQSADVLVHAASMEGFGLAVADAVAIGLPVVATRVGSIPEVVRDGLDGYLVEYGNAKAFAKSVTEAVDDKQKLTRRGPRPQLTRFSWDRTVQETLDLYEGLVNGAKAVSEPVRLGG